MSNPQNQIEDDAKDRRNAERRRRIFEDTNISLLALETDDDRLGAISILLNGICCHCGSLSLPCYCMMDD